MWRVVVNGDNSAILQRGQRHIVIVGTAYVNGGLPLQHREHDVRYHLLSSDGEVFCATVAVTDDLLPDLLQKQLLRGYQIQASLVQL